MKAQMYKGIWHNAEDFDENGRSKIFNSKPFGIKTENKKAALVVKSNNPKGYNKYKKKPKVEIIKKNKVTKEQVQEAYIELWKAKRLVLSKAQIYARLNNEFMGYDKINKELALQYDKKKDKD